MTADFILGCSVLYIYFVCNKRFRLLNTYSQIKSLKYTTATLRTGLKEVDFTSDKDAVRLFRGSLLVRCPRKPRVHSNYFTLRRQQQVF